MRRPGQGGLLAVVQLLHLAEHQDGLTEYFTELTQTEVAEYMRPNLFANTPDILHEYLQTGGRPAFQIRAGPGRHAGGDLRHLRPAVRAVRRHARGRPGSEEYLDSEKYQVRHWDLDRPGPCATSSPGSTRSAARTPRCTTTATSGSSRIDNDQMIAYAKATPDLSNIIIVIVNLDPTTAQSGWASARLGARAWAPSYQVHDLISDARYLWHGEWNFVQLDPHACPRTSSASGAQRFRSSTNASRRFGSGLPVFREAGRSEAVLTSQFKNSMIDL